MTGTPLYIFIFFGVLVLVTLIAAWMYSSKTVRESRTTMHEKNDLKILYDQLRKEKFDLEEKMSQIQGQERTYKVAYEDWKSKYSVLEDKYQQLKRDSESHSPEEMVHLKNEVTLRDKVNESLTSRLKDLESQLAALHSNSPAPSNNNDSKIVSELKSVLDQHLAIISNIIGDERMGQYTQKNIPSDPLHLIKGIDSDVSAKLQAQGIRSFEQIIHTSKRDLKKWMLEFEEVDEKLIESWPYQAEAILNVKSLNS